MINVRNAVLTVIGALVLVSSFSLTLVLLDYFIETDPYPELTRAFRDVQIKTPQDLERVAQSAGLKRGDLFGIKPGVGLVANIGFLTRDQKGYVHFVGYAFDGSAEGNPVRVYLIVDGRPVGSAPASGPRQDVAQGFKLEPAVAANVALNGTSSRAVPCGNNKELFALIVSRKKEYMILEPTGTVPSNGTIPAAVAGCPA